MKQTWRWFGPKDTVSVADMLQAGVQGVVTALHHVPTGDVWAKSEIAKRQAEISQHPDGRPTGLAWDVVESLPVSEDIKKQQGNWRAHVAAYKQSLQHLAEAGIRVVCYNFMPILDWTRTDLGWARPDGARCMRFDYPDFVAFDAYILKRNGVEGDYAPELLKVAKARFDAMSAAEVEGITKNVVFGLPGAAEGYTLDGLRQQIATYQDISANRLRSNFVDFLTEVVPVAEGLGIRLCCHPDDPPFDLLGLPRIMSTEADFRTIIQAVDSPANGITLCTGSLGARPDNDLPGMIRRMGAHIHFLHLRNVTRETPDIRGSFFEDRHLEGGTDMVAVVAAVLGEEASRRQAGRDDCEIPMRPDHGQDILDDQRRKSQPGYPAIGRLKGLAELRGIEAALKHAEFGHIRAAAE